MLLRIPLAFEITADHVTDAAWEASWELVELGVADDDEAQIDVYEATGGVTVSHVSDPRVQLEYLLVEGEAIDSVVTEARKRLAWYDGEAIRQLWDNAADVDDRATAVFLAGVSASAFREATWQVINAALGDSDPLLRQAGITAIGYTQWPEWRFVLRELADGDRDHDVASDALAALSALNAANATGAPVY
ncbi:MAG: hypothetical protein ACK46X_13200 [Candidatus Sericytochromatia bacterium]